jgi:hypothetical protein
MLWAAILFIWEIVGIDLNKAQEGGDNVSAITRLVKPQIVPWALLILVIYFAFRLRVEWGQSDPGRRQVREARMEYLLVFTVASAACALYLFQLISRVHFVDILRDQAKMWSIILGIFIVAIPCNVWVLWHYLPQTTRQTRVRLLLATVFPFVIVVINLAIVFGRKEITNFNWKFVVIGIIVTGPLLVWEIATLVKRWPYQTKG